MGSQNHLSPMPKKNKHPVEPDHESGGSDSENYIENGKYLKKLKLQRSVLIKLIVSEEKPHAENTSIDPDGTYSN